MKFLPLHIFETWKARHKAITGNALACKQVLWGALAAGQKRKRACMCQECLKPDCKLSLFFGPLTECPWALARRLGVPLPQEQSSVVLLQYRCLSLMSINFKRKNKNWTKDQWNWYDIHELHDIYLIGVVGKWMDIICLITIINHPTEMWNSKVQFKIDPYAQLKNWTFQVKNLIPSTKYMKKLTFEPFKSQISNLGQVSWIKIEWPTWEFRLWNDLAFQMPTSSCTKPNA